MALAYWLSGGGFGRLCLSDGGERLAADGHRLCRDEHEGDDGDIFAAVDAVVDGATLDQNIAGLERHRRTVELHVDLAGNDHGVIDRIGTVPPRYDAGLVAHNPKH